MSSTAAHTGADPLAWSALERKALLIGALFFHNDIESLCQLLPGIPVRFEAAWIAGQNV